jgi:SAM-dependent methyltransferase
MTAKVLRSPEEIATARLRLEARGMSALRGSRLWRRIAGLLPAAGAIRPPVGDRLKSWDLLATLEWIEGNFAKDDPVLDLGCYGSELLPALWRLGFRRLAGIDLQRGVDRMPHAGAIDYVRGDFLAAPFAEASFAAITAISAIEHGYDAEALFREVARLLRPRGAFLASFDYWPEKIDTSNMPLFGLDWRIFSRAEVDELLAVARGHGLEPVGALDLDPTEPVIEWGGRWYTFAWMVLRKSAT